MCWRRGRHGFFSLVINNESVEMWLQLITTERTPAHTVNSSSRQLWIATDAATAMATTTPCTVKTNTVEEEKNPLKREMMHALWAWWIVVVLSLIDINFLISRSRFADTWRNRIYSYRWCVALVYTWCTVNCGFSFYSNDQYSEGEHIKWKS